MKTLWDTTEKNVGHHSKNMGFMGRLINAHQICLSAVLRVCYFSDMSTVNNDVFNCLKKILVQNPLCHV